MTAARAIVTRSPQCSTPVSAAAFLHYPKLSRVLRVKQEDLQPIQALKMNSHDYFPALEVVWVALAGVAEPPRHSHLRARNQTMNPRIALLSAVAERWPNLEGHLEMHQESAKGQGGRRMTTNLRYSIAGLRMGQRVHGVLGKAGMATTITGMFILVDVKAYS